jgi:hypothetical protein
MGASSGAEATLPSRRACIPGTVGPADGKMIGLVTGLLADFVLALVAPKSVGTALKRRRKIKRFMRAGFWDVISLFWPLKRKNLVFSLVELGDRGRRQRHIGTLNAFRIEPNLRYY